MISREEIQALARPELAEVLAALGQDVMIVRPGESTGTLDDWGREVTDPPERTSTRCVLYPLSDDVRVRLSRGANLPVPRYEAILPHTAPVGQPGFTLEVVEGDAVRVLHPTSDAVDEGGVGVAWIVHLSAPGDR